MIFMRKSKNNLRLHRKKRVRAKVSGTTERPRLCVFRSLRSISAQVIDDEKGNTLVSATLSEAKAKNNIEGAGILGKLLAKKCLEKKIDNVVFDRAGYKYHGKVKALAENARGEGLKF
jgi:large subunit ribosomal protein L18